MKKLTQALRRPLYAVAALGMMLGLVASAVVPGQVSAYGEVTDRAIKMSSAIVDDTSVNYEVTITLENAAQGIAIDFCGGSPLYEDTCSAVSGLDVSSTTVASMTGGTTNDWSELDLAATHIEAGGTSEAGASTLVLTFDGITNPDSTGSFYARIYTYGAADPDWTAVGTAGTVVDFGGIALSINDSINITARVQEKLLFCVSAADPGADCSGTSTPDIVIGHGSPTIIDETAVDTTPAYVQLSTNAQSGAIVRMKIDNTCGSLSRDGGTTCDIPAVNSGGNTSAAITLGTAEFGLRCSSDANLTAQAPYATGGQYGLDTTTVGDNVTTTYGDTILDTGVAVNNEESTLTFAATASLTTPAGLYQASMDLIATGTF